MKQQINCFAVTVTRTGKSGLQLTQQLQQKGFHAWFNPTLKIVAEELLLPIEDFQQVIFVSPNAVKYSVVNNQMLVDVLPEQLIAVGPGTADSLYQAGFKEVVIPREYNSEGLLQLSELQQVKGQHLLIVKGKGGRSLLVEKLTERGAICHKLEVYRRVTSKLDQTSWQAFIAPEKDLEAQTKIVTIGSVDAMKALNFNLGADFDYNQLTLVVASNRIADSAYKNGYQKILVADSASNDAMLAAIVGMVEK